MGAHRPQVRLQALRLMCYDALDLTELLCTTVEGIGCIREYRGRCRFPDPERSRIVAGIREARGAGLRDYLTQFAFVVEIAHGIRCNHAVEQLQVFCYLARDSMVRVRHEINSSAPCFLGAQV